MPDQPAIDLYTDRLVERAVKAEMRVTKLEWELRDRKWPEWREIDSAPKDGTPILIAQGDDLAVAWFDTEYVWLRPGGAWISDYNRSDTYEYDPTHWLPLPTAPTTGED
jgi:hypothetical protein